MSVVNSEMAANWRCWRALHGSETLDMAKVKDKMNAVLLTIVCTLALLHGWNAMVYNPSRNSNSRNKYNNRPCQRTWNNNGFNRFVQKHILQQNFNRNSKEAWQMYLENEGLCNRPLQSFIKKKDEKRVVKICNGSGRRVRDNLCISTSTFKIYDVEVNTSSCRITRITENTTKVIVACDKVGNQCRPVHFEKYVFQEPTDERCHG
ncbi:uncharacterized protein LOC112846516 [Oreochromis niloticus]|uniref:uncharacterized protein LOC112846516 n=1 Tax=Oreochromis niloticus TaxID=8128 RepID=UPI000DF44EE7|nr:uncharacterized protein LOC112846516 [Oreochromis niloticus]